jgi:hypothetical protein
MVCHVTLPTHDMGGLLDVVITRADLQSLPVDVIEIAISDHRLLRWTVIQSHNGNPKHGCHNGYPKHGCHNGNPKHGCHNGNPKHGWSPHERHRWEQHGWWLKLICLLAASVA